MDTKDLITTTQAAAILRCDPSAIRHRIRNGLESEQIGRDSLVSRKAIEEIRDALKANGTKKRGPKPKKKGKRGRSRA